MASDMLIKICAIVITGAVTALMLSELKGSFSFAVRIGALTVAIGAVIALAASAVTSVNGIIGDNESVSRYAFIILRFFVRCNMKKQKKFITF